MAQDRNSRRETLEDAPERDEEDVIGRNDDDDFDDADERDDNFEDMDDVEEE